MNVIHKLYAVLVIGFIIIILSGEAIHDRIVYKENVHQAMDVNKTQQKISENKLLCVHMHGCEKFVYFSVLF